MDANQMAEYLERSKYVGDRPGAEYTVISPTRTAPVMTMREVCNYFGVPLAFMAPTLNGKAINAQHPQPADMATAQTRRVS